jgi:hypothetical protein
MLFVLGAVLAFMHFQKDVNLTKVFSWERFTHYWGIALAIVILVVKYFLKSIAYALHFFYNTDFSFITPNGIDFTLFNTYGVYFENINYFIPVEEILIYGFFTLNLFIACFMVKLARSFRATNYI